MLIFSMNGSKGKVLILNAFPLLDSNLVPRGFWPGDEITCTGIVITQIFSRRGARHCSSSNALAGPIYRQS